MKTKTLFIALFVSAQLFAGENKLPFFGFRPVQPENGTNGTKQDLLNYIDGLLELDSTTLYISKKTGKTLPYEVYVKNRKSGADALVRQQYALLINRNLKTKGKIAEFLGLGLTDYAIDFQRNTVKKAIQSDLLYLATIPTGMKIYTTGELIDPNADFTYVRDSAHYRFPYLLKDGASEAGLFFNWGKLGVKTVGMDLSISMLCFNTNAGVMPELEIVKTAPFDYGEKSNDVAGPADQTTTPTAVTTPNFAGAPNIVGTTPATTPIGSNKQTSGFACWDLNKNGYADVSEDQNGDGVINDVDCNGSGITMREYNLATENAYLKGKLEALESCPCPNQGGVPLQQMNPQQVYCQQGGQYVPYQQGQMINAGQEVFYNQGGNWQRKVAIANTVFNGIGTIVGLGLQAWQIWGGSRGWYAPQNTFNVFNNTTTTLPPVTTIGGRGYDFGGLGGVTTLGSGTDFGGIR